MKRNRSTSAQSNDAPFNRSTDFPRPQAGSRLRSAIRRRLSLGTQSPCDVFRQVAENSLTFHHRLCIHRYTNNPGVMPTCASLALHASSVASVLSVVNPLLTHRMRQNRAPFCRSHFPREAAIPGASRVPCAQNDFILSIPIDFLRNRQNANVAAAATYGATSQTYPNKIAQTPSARPLCAPPAERSTDKMKLSCTAW